MDFPLGDFLDQIDAAAGAFAHVCRPTPSVFVNRPLIIGEVRGGKLLTLRELEQLDAAPRCLPDSGPNVLKSVNPISKMMQDIMDADELQDPWLRPEPDRTICLPAPL